MEEDEFASDKRKSCQKSDSQLQIEKRMRSEQDEDLLKIDL